MNIGGRIPEKIARAAQVALMLMILLLGGIASRAAEPKESAPAKIGGQVPRSEIRASAGDEVFRDGFVPTIRIEIPNDGMTTLRKYRWKWGGNDEDRIAVKATIKEGKDIYTNVAVRLKGAAGSFRPVDDNPGLSLNFDKWANGQRFHGLQKISLANSLQDQTFVSDKFSRELYNKAGVPTPRAGHARVYLNGRDLGLHVITEGWNKQFLRSHFKKADGNLYDCGFTQEINGKMHVNSGDNPDDHSDLEALAAACDEAKKTKSIEPLLPVLDIDRFISLAVLDSLLWNWDGYSINHNNYRVFSDKESGRMVFMPHGLDQMFWRPEAPIMPGSKSIVAQAVLASAEGRKRFMNRARELMNSGINSTALVDRVREISESIQPALSAIGSSARRQQQNAVDQFCRLIILRMASLNMQLTGSSNLITLATGKSAALTNWTAQSSAASTDANGSLHLVALRNSAPASWQTTAWLEVGYYRVQGRVKSKGVVPGAAGSGAGFRVISQRKPTAGTSWDWFPFRESRDYEKRGEMTPSGGRNDRATGESDWTEISYDFDLRQPMADVQVFCELRADKGEAWFDPNSIRITRRPSPGPAKSAKSQAAAR